MLKGQLDVDIEFMGGAIIFVILSLIMFVEILAPLLVVDYTMVTSKDDIRALVTANLAKSRFEEKLGDGNGNMVQDNLDKQVAKGLEGLDATSDLVIVEGIDKEVAWAFGSGEGERMHDIYSTVTSSHAPVDSESQVVMENGKEYMVHAYLIGDPGKNMAFDIYQDYLCGSGGSGPEESGEYRLVSCDEISDLELVEGDIESYLRGMIVEARTGSRVARVKPGSDVTAADLETAGIAFGSLQACSDTGGTSMGTYLCTRHVGDFVIPVKVSVQT